MAFPQTPTFNKRESIMRSKDYACCKTVVDSLQVSHTFTKTDVENAFYMLFGIKVSCNHIIDLDGSDKKRKIVSLKFDNAELASRFSKVFDILDGFNSVKFHIAK